MFYQLPNEITDKVVGHTDDLTYLVLSRTSKLFRIRKLQLTESPCTTACREGRIEILRWLCSEGEGFKLEECCVTAASTGQLGILKWIQLVYDYSYHSRLLAKIIETASKGGFTRILDWCCKLTGANVVDIPQICSIAAENGRRNVIKWLLKRNCKLVSQAELLYDHAISEGQTKFLRWVWKHVHRFIEEDIDYEAPLIAATKGHLSTLKWLKRHGYPIHKWNLHLSAGTLDVLKWCYPEDCDEETHLSILSNTSNLDAVKWLCEKRKVAGDKITIFFANNTYDESETETIKVMQYLRFEVGGQWDDYILRNALINRCFVVAEWLIENGCPLDETSLKWFRSGGHNPFDTDKWVKLKKMIQNQ